MSEWWTYHLSDFLLFAPRTYYRLFELYNAAIWPGAEVQLEQALQLKRAGAESFVVLTKLAEKGPGFEIYEYVAVG